VALALQGGDKFLDVHGLAVAGGDAVMEQDAHRAPTLRGERITTSRKTSVNGNLHNLEVALATGVYVPVPAKCLSVVRDDKAAVRLSGGRWQILLSITPRLKVAAAR
jgi:hypothetical protein